MDFLGSEFIKIVSSFEKCNVQYIIVGGFATNFHGYKRTTGDIDFWVKDAKANRINIITALDAIGYGKLEALMSAKLLPGYCEVILDNGVYADLMGYIYGFDQSDFDNCYDQSEQISVAGVNIKFLHYNHHIYSKGQSSRLKDQLDLQELNRIREEE